jgi:hypothetical protein
MLMETKVRFTTSSPPNGNNRTIRLSAILAFALLCVGIFSLLPLGAAHAQTGLNLVVVGSTTDSKPANGYYVALSQDGKVISTGFTTATFSVVSGETYSIQADGYGGCNLAYWDIPVSGGEVPNYSNPLTFTATENNAPEGMLLHPVYSCSETGTSKLTVASQDTNGNALTGFYTALFQNGNEVGTGYTTATYTLNDGQSYTIQADSYGNCFFVHWADGSTSASRSISITSNTQITAVYNCSGSSSSSLTINSEDQNGNPIFGYYAVLGSSGSVVATGYTTHTFATNAGQSYSVQVDSYGSCTFSKWADGSTSNPRSFTASSGALTFTAVYNC